jgi:hypothetical protein
VCATNPSTSTAGQRSESEESLCELFDSNLRVSGDEKHTETLCAAKNCANKILTLDEFAAHCGFENVENLTVFLKGHLSIFQVLSEVSVRKAPQAFGEHQANAPKPLIAQKGSPQALSETTTASANRRHMQDRARHVQQIVNWRRNKYITNSTSTAIRYSSRTQQQIAQQYERHLQTNRPIPFMRLPQELRDIIYTLVMDDVPT